jgi:hypothetical protein
MYVVNKALPSAADPPAIVGDTGVLSSGQARTINDPNPTATTIPTIAPTARFW